MSETTNLEAAKFGEIDYLAALRNIPTDMLQPKPTAAICWKCGGCGFLEDDEMNLAGQCEVCNGTGKSDSKERPWLLQCPKCGKRCGSQRAGAEFEHQNICWGCWYVWPGGR